MFLSLNGRSTTAILFNIYIQSSETFFHSFRQSLNKFTYIRARSHLVYTSWKSHYITHWPEHEGNSSECTFYACPFLNKVLYGPKSTLEEHLGIASSMITQSRADKYLNYTNLKVPCKQVDWLDPVQIFNMYEVVDSLQYQNEVWWPNFENLFTPKCTLILRKKNNIWCPCKMTSKTCIFDFLSL